MVGTRFFPYVVGTGLAVCGLAIFANGLRSRLTRPDRDGAPPLNWGGFLSASGLLLLYILLYQPLGFVLSSILLMVAGARAFGSRRPVRDAIAGVALSGGAFLLFTRLIGVELPVGRLFEAML